MTRHLGLSVSLSVLIVVFFAVILYQPEGGTAPPRAPQEGGPALPTAAGDGEAPPAPPETVSEEVASVSDPVEPSAAPVARALPVLHRAPAPQPLIARAEHTPPRPAAAVPRPKPRPRVTDGARLAFIEADAGESVEDVARRIYGSSDAANALWRANRDILPDRAARLSSRTVLRTP